MAPNNEAFTKAQGWDSKNESQVTNILEYHLLQGTISTGSVPEGPSEFFATLLQNTSYANVTGGQNMIVNKQPGDVVIFTSGSGSRSTVLESDIAFAGGLIQVVDTLMVPPARLEPTSRDAYQDLTAFLAALYATDLVTFFAETPDVTIFAPRNAAFQLVSGALSSLSKEDLTAVLKYHIITGAVIPSADLKNGTNYTTAATGTSAPAPLYITRAGNNLYIDQVQVIQPDILIANGVVHMVDGVMNPKDATATPNPALGTQPPVFSLTGATATGTGAPLPFTSYLPCVTDCPAPTKSSAPNQNSSVAKSSPAGSSSAGVTTSSSKAAAAGPRCTGVSAALGIGFGVGVLGLGLGAAAIV